MALSVRKRLIILVGVVALGSYGAMLVFRGASHSTVGDRSAKLFASKASEEFSRSPAAAPSFYQLNESEPSSDRTGAGTVGLRVPPLAFIDEAAAGPRLVLHGQLTILVKNFDEAFDRIQTISNDLGGCLSDFQVQRPEKDHAQGTITLRVPPAQYFQALNKLRTLGQTECENSSVQDVTRRCLTLDTRIKHRREIELRMVDAVRNRSNTVDSLAMAGNTLERAEDSLDRLETERYQLQQDLLNATIRLNLHESAVVRGTINPVKPGMLEPLKLALQNAATELVNDVSRAIYLVLVLAPWLLIGWLIYRPASKRIRRFLEDRRQRSSPTENVDETNSTTMFE